MSKEKKTGRMSRLYGYMLRKIKGSHEGLVADSHSRLYKLCDKGIRRVFEDNTTCRQWKKDRLARKLQRRKERHLAKKAAA